MTIENRLKEARKNKGYSSGAAAADAFGWSKPTYRSHENGSRGIPRDKLEVYARAFHVSIEWLLTGRGKKDAPQGVLPTFLPVLGAVQGGAFVEAVPYHDELLLPVAPSPEFEEAKQFLLEVKGPSMNLEYAPGTYVHCVQIEFQEDITPEHGDHVIVERRRGGLREVTVKEYVLTTEGQELWPRSSDPAWQKPISLHDGDHIDEIVITALVIGSYRVRRRNN